MLKERYGDLERLHEESRSLGDLERRLQEFKGVGPVGVNIFLRELHGESKTEAFSNCCCNGKKIGLNRNEVECYKSQLVRLNLEYCMKHRSSQCPLKDRCPDRDKQ
jgi:hypothetical protein